MFMRAESSTNHTEPESFLGMRHEDRPETERRHSHRKILGGIEGGCVRIGGQN